MLIRNNMGEIVGEMDSTYDHAGGRRDSTTNTLYGNGRPVAQNVSVRDNPGKVPQNECDRWKDYALARVQRTGSQKKRYRRKAIGDLNVDSTRHGARHGG